MSEDRKRDGAIRLFGALSGVDEEYLAACEEECSGASRKHIGKIRVFAQKYGKAAAVIGIAVIGLGLVGLQSSNLPMSPNKSLSPSQMQNENNFMSGGAYAEQELTEDKDGELAATPGSIAPDQFQDGKNGADEERQEMAVSGTNKYGQDREDNQITMAEEDATAKETALTLEAARETAVVGKYLPAVWPREGEPAWVMAKTSAGQERVTLCWTYPDETGSFLWTVQNLGEEEPDWTQELPAGQLVLEGADMSRADMDTQLADAVGTDGRIADGKLYISYPDAGNYILVEFQGSCDADTLWEMLGSVG